MVASPKPATIKSAKHIPAAKPALPQHTAPAPPPAPPPSDVPL
jgi:hypothetical protein